jgi:hypothetical protein
MVRKPSRVPPVEKNEKLQANNLLGRFGAKVGFSLQKTDHRINRFDVFFL